MSFRRMCLKLWEELCSQGTYNYMHFHSIEAWDKTMLKVENVKKVKENNFKIL